MKNITLANSASSGSLGVLRLVRRGVSIAKYVVRSYENIKKIQSGNDPRGLAAEEFIRDTSEIGPTAIKLSQFLSARSDVLDNKTMKVIERFRNDVITVAEDIPDFIGYEFDKIPISTASITSVYKGKRKSDNNDVVLKIIRAGVKERIAEDLPLFTIVLRAAKLAGIKGAENLLEIVRECSPIILNELDLREEAKVTRIFKRRFEYLGWLTIPIVYEAGERYMISEYVSSNKITNAANPNTFITERLFELYARVILDVGLRKHLKAIVDDIDKTVVTFK